MYLHCLRAKRLGTKTVWAHTASPLEPTQPHALIWGQMLEAAGDEATVPLTLGREAEAKQTWHSREWSLNPVGPHGQPPCGLRKSSSGLLCKMTDRQRHGIKSG